MQPRPFKQVDVFTDEPYRGNPLAVVLDGAGLSDRARCSTSRDWTNLSETTFLLPPTQRRAPTTACASSAPAASCRSPATPRWAAATPGCRPAASRAASTSCRNAGSAWCSCGATASAPGLRRAAAAQRSGPLAEADVALIARGLGVPAQRHRRPRLVRQRPALARRAAGQRRAGAGAAARRTLRLGGPRARSAWQGGRGPAHGAGDDCAFEVRAFFRRHQRHRRRPGHRQPERRLAQWLIGAGHRARRATSPRQGTAWAAPAACTSSATTAGRSGSAAPRSPASTDRCSCEHARAHRPPGGRRATAWSKAPPGARPRWA